MTRKWYNVNVIYIQALDGLELTGQELHDILNEIDLSYNGRLELADYFQVKEKYDSADDEYFG